MQRANPWNKKASSSAREPRSYNQSNRANAHDALPPGFDEAYPPLGSENSFVFVRKLL